MPYQIIDDLVAARANRSDAEVLRELADLAPLADEGDPSLDWLQVYLYLALAGIAAQRKLHPAIKLLLDRASYGDPGETMRGLRHFLEEIVNPDWSKLFELCADAATSPRRGTRMWALSQLAVLRDKRAKPIFEAALSDEAGYVRYEGENGLRALAMSDD
jgi:hypothetical protein